MKATLSETIKGMSDSSLQQLDEFLKINHFPDRKTANSIESYWNELNWEDKEDLQLTLKSLIEGFEKHQYSSSQTEESLQLESLEILRGQDKSGKAEEHDLIFRPGDVICLVGPTGAGKSRFLGDIECLAQGDTPTGRKILINGKEPDGTKRFSGESGLVAQITQNMNFVMDLPVLDFLHMHAESRSLKNPDAVVQRVLDSAIEMAGEAFGPDTQITQLSGGQSRSLMIADAAYLSPKPIVLIDEIENAGVNRTQALKLFVEKGKIVLLATHDPLLALCGDKRLVIKNGAVQKIIESDEEEIRTKNYLEQFDRIHALIREQLRMGKKINSFWKELEKFK